MGSQSTHLPASLHNGPPREERTRRDHLLPQQREVQVCLQPLRHRRRVQNPDRRSRSPAAVGVELPERRH